MLHQWILQEDWSFTDLFARVQVSEFMRVFSALYHLSFALLLSNTGLHFMQFFPISGSP